MIFELAIVEDRGSYWHVTNVTKNTLDNLANRAEKMLKLSYSVYQIIQQALIDGKQVRINKTMTTDEVLPWEVIVVTQDADDQTTTLQAVKDASIIKIRMLITPELSKIAGLTLYGFMVLNNDLVNAGYAITNENREEQYIKILETNDESLITKLEDYLNYKDEIEMVANLERRFSAFKSKIKEAVSTEEVSQLEQTFLETFYTKH